MKTSEIELVYGNGMHALPADPKVSLYIKICFKKIILKYFYLFSLATPGLL